MPAYTKLVITALVAAAAFAALVSSASGRTFSVTNQNVRVAWSSLELTAGTIVVRCGVTLEGSLHARVISKVLRSLIGYITAATLRHPCTNGEMWLFNGVERLNITTLTNTLPWHITYEGFTGTLPDITDVKILFSGIRFRVQEPTFRVLCTYTTGNNGNATGTVTRTTMTGALNNLRASGVINSETGACPSGSFTNRTEDGIFSLLGTVTRITLSLI